MMSGETNASGAPTKLDQIIADYIQAVEAGRVPDRQKLLANHPELAVELRTFFEDQDRFERVAAPERNADPAGQTVDLAKPHSAAETPTLQSGKHMPSEALHSKTLHYFGDYELIDEIARGGMGVVYKARQMSLNRIVALKMILAGQLAEGEDIKRFRAEAEAAASLDHPNIVPIYEIGEHEDRQYFTMKLIVGSSLAREVPRLVKDAKASARAVVLVARAVHYAHQRGMPLTGPIRLACPGPTFSTLRCSPIQVFICDFAKEMGLFCCRRRWPKALSNLIVLGLDFPSQFNRLGL